MLVIKEYSGEDIEAIAGKKLLFTHLHTTIDPAYYAPSSNADEEFKNYIKKRINDNDFKIFTAKDNGACIGYVMGWIEYRPPIYHKRKIGYLSNIYVDETHQKRKTGEKLYLTMERWFRGKKVDFIEIKADARNSAAIKSFKKYGFKELSVTFYKDTKADRHE